MLTCQVCVLGCLMAEDRFFDVDCSSKRTEVSMNGRWKQA
jgi:hypothetical protein